MTPEIAKLVGEKIQPKELTDLCETIKGLVKQSRTEMAKNYANWDASDAVFRGERKPDKQDQKAAARGEPTKLILPYTYSQVMTFAAFGYGVYNDRDYFYETIPSGIEDEQPSKIANALLEQNLTYNKYRTVRLVQSFIDIARFGVGVTKECWHTDEVPVVNDVPVIENAEAVRPDLAQPVAPQQKMKKEVTYTVKYQGNKIVNITPYRFFPDVRLPLTRWAEGEFCADETEESKIALHTYVKRGLCAGLEHVADLPIEAFADRRLQFLKKDNTASVQTAPNDKSYYLLTEVQIKLNPSETFVAKGVPLAEGVDCTQVYIIWILNDDRIVRISEAGYNHEEFGYNVAQFLDDQNRFVNFALADIIAALQDTATWFLNSRVTSVRKTIFPQFIVDESGIEIDDIVKRSPIIRLKQGKGGAGIDNWIKQLDTNDVTQGHLNDIAMLGAQMKEASGINDTMLGNFFSGRRSAKEAGNVQQSAATRLLMIFACIWESKEAPQARKMLSNLRQGLDEPQFVRVYGDINAQLIPGAFAAFKGTPQLQPAQPIAPYRVQQVTKANLVGNYDFNIFNGTLPSQRQQTAQVIIEYLQNALKDPRVTLVTGLDPQLLLYEALELLGVRNVQRFRLTPERLQQLMFMAGGAGNGSPAGPTGPGEGGPPQ